MSLFTIKHVHEGTVKIEVEHKYSGEKEIVENRAEPPTSEHGQPPSMKKGNMIFIADFLMGMGGGVVASAMFDKFTESFSLYSKLTCGILVGLAAMIAAILVKRSALKHTGNT